MSPWKISSILNVLKISQFKIAAIARPIMGLREDSQDVHGQGKKGNIFFSRSGNCQEILRSVREFCIFRPWFSVFKCSMDHEEGV